MSFDDVSEFKAKYCQFENDSDMDSVSSFQSLDEGAIAPLSMD